MELRRRLRRTWKAGYGRRRKVRFEAQSVFVDARKSVHKGWTSVKVARSGERGLALSIAGLTRATSKK